jgi:hypothetical protein
MKDSNFSSGKIKIEEDEKELPQCNDDISCIIDISKLDIENNKPLISVFLFIILYLFLIEVFVFALYILL